MFKSIQTISEKRLVGMKTRTAMRPEAIGKLWGSFMPQLKTIKARNSDELIALQDYSTSNPENPTTEFDMWALAEVDSFENQPEGLSNYRIPEGDYAIFLLKGTGVEKLMNYVMGEWLPASNFQLDTSRPHFQVMGKAYKNNHPDSEEDFYIPVKLKTI
ncbi:GyrI-like domain-containing protein [Winogradskyella maritima]|uniref:GyrI-like domain-containing protein n=1 Tax=Winogradskyella maritima TaxID=1517766 RepID=A0ABV8AJH2_9FLAO|nr:GyrI-like domain-containing protein [Winogradskyella maritima]